MKIAISGAGGFIGRYVLAELESRSCEVVAHIRRSSVTDLPFSVSAIVDFDLHEAPTDAYNRLGRPDVLLHLAWSELSDCGSLYHFEKELPAQYRFLKGLISAGLESLVVAGTCFEYGMQAGALSEELLPQPDNPYGYAKNALRYQLECLQKLQPFQLSWARIFYMYGDGQSENSLLPQLKRSVENGESFFNMSGGEQLRDYLPVTDVARHLVTLALAKRDIGVINVCSGIPVSVRGLVERWIRENNWLIEPRFGVYPYRNYEPMAFWGDPKKLHAFLADYQ